MIRKSCHRVIAIHTILIFIMFFVSRTAPLAREVIEAAGVGDSQILARQAAVVFQVERPNRALRAQQLLNAPAESRPGESRRNGPGTFSRQGEPVRQTRHSARKP